MGLLTPKNNKGDKKADNKQKTAVRQALSLLKIVQKLPELIRNLLRPEDQEEVKLILSNLPGRVV